MAHADVNPGVSQVRIISGGGEPIQSGWYFCGLDHGETRHFVIDPNMDRGSLMTYELVDGEALALIDPPLHWVADVLDVDVQGLDERQVARMCVTRILQMRDGYRTA